MSFARAKGGLRLELPAPSANLGPAFDAAGLALSLKLSLEAVAAEEFSLTANGRDAVLCGLLETNLILDTYRDVLRDEGLKVVPLRIELDNEIPLGMGCGSSAAALLAGVALAVHFGQLNWSDEEIVSEASRREGHPDNVAACWHGGFTVSAQDGTGGVSAVSFEGDPAWRLVLAMQTASLATKKARALLPGEYARGDAVFNLQRATLLVAAFAQRRLDLLRVATEDRMHQPYRRGACPLLNALLPLAAEPGVAAVTLSGAGPSVLVFVDGDAAGVQERVRQAVPAGTELIELRIAGGAKRVLLG